MARLKSLTKNQAAFLDMVALSELGEELIEISDDGYNILVGSTPSDPVLFHSYKDHPRQFVMIPRLEISSSAAGRYQILERMYDYYRKMLNLKDFSPESQDAIGLEYLKERNAVEDLEKNDLDSAIAKCSNIWASLPGNNYRQHQNTMHMLYIAYTNAGGVANA